MRLLLHIGTEKTGTTSLQRFCHANRDALAERGVLYPRNLGGEAQRLVPSYGLSLDSADEFVRAHGVTDQAGLDALHERTRKTLEAQVRASRAGICLISSEHLHSRLRTPEQVARVRGLLEPLFDGIEVFVHLRPQIDVAVSLASTQSRVGGAVRRGFFDRVHPRTPYYNYDMLLGMWEEAFGAADVTCLAFRRDPDALSFVARRLGLDLAGLPHPARLNEALDVRTIAMVNALAESGEPDRIDFRVLDMLPVQERLALDLLTAQGIQSRFVPSNRALLARRPELSAPDLQPDWSRYPEHGNLHVLDAPCPFGPALAHLVRRYNEVIRENGKG